ncbi:hypothetical protein DPMN_113960 [Dreissena polymorpha]|uniref:Kyphoscoliosis peptidase n=1 Tax=Dreissena polymorpha TaxID=45954 RepID=A0A9D4QSC5_DREPO|nr:hypothetical protein DPMN_113960 [Dreissena polymorpha]
MGTGMSMHHHKRLLPREPTLETVLVPEIEAGYPSPEPPRTTKKDIYNPSENVDIYKHALTASRNLEDSWDDLVRYLTGPYSKDIQKVRAIFSWLGIQRIESELFLFVFKPDSEDECTPRKYKKLIKDREGSYSTLFALMCRKAGIKCAIINGISKGFGYNVGDKKVAHLRDRWAAVYIDGWRLVHPLWSYKTITTYKSGHWNPDCKLSNGISDTASDDGTNGAKHEFNEFYFLTDPQELINMCFPDDDQWQLIDNKLNIDSWTRAPLVMKRFSTEGFKNSAEFKSTLESENGVCCLVVQPPRAQSIEFQLSHDFSFNYLIDKTESEETIFLEKYLIIARDVEENKWLIEARMPIAGLYRITIYGGSCTSQKLPWICDVGIMCLDPTSGIKPYPDIPEIGYGPMPITEKYALLNPSHPNGMLFVKTKQTQHITFHINKRVTAKVNLIGKGVHKRELEKWAKCTVNIQGRHLMLDIMVRLFKEGEYALKVFLDPDGKGEEESADTIEDKGKLWVNVVNYYLSTDSPRDNGLLVKDTGFKTAKEIHIEQALDEAGKGKDLFELKSRIENGGGSLKEEEGSFGTGTLKMEYLELAKGLKDAIANKNFEMLVKAIGKANESCHEERLAKLLSEARTLRDNFPTWRKARYDVLELRTSSVADLVEDENTSIVKQHVVAATLALLGDNMAELQEWPALKTRIEAADEDNVLHRIRAMDHDNVPDDRAHTALGILKEHTEEQVADEGDTAVVFYRWCISLVRRREVPDVKQTQEEDAISK